VRHQDRVVDAIEAHGAARAASHPHWPVGHGPLIEVAGEIRDRQAAGLIERIGGDQPAGLDANHIQVEVLQV
jgi:hypothetical protein